MRESDVRSVYDHNEHVRIVVQRGAGHLPQLEQPAAVFELIVSTKSKL